MTTQFDFSSIADLGAFWDGGAGKSNWGGGQFNKYSGQAGIDHNLDLLYQNLIGRNADPSGRKYWGDQISSGATTYQGVADAIKASGEYTDQQKGIAGGLSANQLKMLDSAYVSPFDANSGSAVAGWKPGDAITASIANAVTTDPNVTGSNYSDQTNKTVGDVISSLGIGGGSNETGSMTYDDSALRDMITGLTGQLGDLRSAFDAYKTQSAQDMQNVWNNANWGWGQTVGGVRTQNELPGWMPKKGGTSGFFGRGGRSGKGLTTASLNI